MRIIEAKVHHSTYNTVGLVVEYSPATGETRVRFPDGVHFVQKQTFVDFSGYKTDPIHTPHVDLELHETVTNFAGLKKSGFLELWSINSRQDVEKVRYK